MNRVQVLVVFCICLLLRNILAEVQKNYKDTIHPIIKCPSSFSTYVGKDQINAYVNYTLPVAADSIDGELEVVLEKGPPPSSKLPIIRYAKDSLVNEHTVVYSTVNSGGLNASCSFKVTVKDRQCDSIHVDKKTMLQVTCTEPKDVYGSGCSFTCFYGHKVKGAASVTCELNEQNEVKWSSSIPTCEEVGCPDLGAPLNGAMDCVPLIVGKKCNMSCNKPYHIPNMTIHGGFFLCIRSNGWVNVEDDPVCTAYCKPGRKEVDNICVECEEGTYQEFAGQTFCEKCPDGRTTESTGSDSRALCITATSTTVAPGSSKLYLINIIGIIIVCVLLLVVNIVVVYCCRRRYTKYINRDTEVRAKKKMLQHGNVEASDEETEDTV